MPSRSGAQLKKISPQDHQLYPTTSSHGVTTQNTTWNIYILHINFTCKVLFWVPSHNCLGFIFRRSHVIRLSCVMILNTLQITWYSPIILVKLEDQCRKYRIRRFALGQLFVVTIFVQLSPTCRNIIWSRLILVNCNCCKIPLHMVNNWHKILTQERADRFLTWVYSKND
jgi:hypothetical protein